MKDKAAHCESCPLYNQSKFKLEGSETPQLVIVGGFPAPVDIKQGAFSSRDSVMVQKLIRTLVNESPTKSKPLIACKYAIMCNPFMRTGFHKPSAEDIYRCSVELKQYLARVKPKVVLLLGVDAFKALGIKSAMRAVRGTIQDHEYGGHKVKVVCTYHPFQVAKSPGFFEVFKTDFKKAFSLVADAIDVYDTDIVSPTKYEDVVATLERENQYIKDRVAKTGKKLVVSVDTETTSLEAHRHDTRMIMISMSLRDNHGLAFPVEHRDTNYTQEQVQNLLRLTEEILDPSRVITVAANAKFDYKWLAYKYGMKMRFFNYDVLLAEHCLDEDKKGEYSLKDLIKDYFPSMGRYEEELQALLAAEKDKAAMEFKECKKKYKEEVDGLAINHWLTLSEEERHRKVTEWSAKKYVTLSDAVDLIEVKTRKVKGEQVIMKKYQNAVLKMLKQVPFEEMDMDDVPVMPLEAPREVTYEDIPIDTLLPYAAIDALGTRKVFKVQWDRMEEDTKRLKKIGNLATISLKDSLTNLSMPMCSKIADMEYQGVRLDRDKAKEYMSFMEEKLKEYEDLLYTEIGREFSLSSSAPDLKQILFEEKRYTPIKKTDTGEPSTDAETLQELYDQYDTPFLKALMGHRKILKAKNTYIKNWLKMSEYDGRLHFSLHQNGTATYRLSSSNLNL